VAEKRKIPPAPNALGARGRKLWRAIATRYELRLDELILLESAARTLDDVERLREALVGADLTVRGSAGQPAANPLLAELRQSRSLLAQHFRQLSLPDLDGTGTEVSKPKSTAHQRAARVRWAGHTTRAAQAAARESGGA